MPLVLQSLFPADGAQFVPINAAVKLEFNQDAKANKAVRFRCPDCALTILSQECLYSKIATFSTEESISLLLDTLFSCYFARDYKRHWDYKLSSAEAAEVNRRADHDRLDR